jgi:hypothetical protein
MESVKKYLGMITLGFAVGPILVVIVVALTDVGEPESPELADGATLAVGLLGVAGLLIAALWYSRAGDRMRSPKEVVNGFIFRVAIAEIGLLLGILGLFITGSLLPAIVGLALFLPALLLLHLGMRRMVAA